MQRRDFLSAAAGAALISQLPGARSLQAAEPAAACCRTYESPAAAQKSPREELAYVTATCVGVDKDRPDYLAVVDLDPKSPTYSKVVARLPMSKPGDELHHFGWNACSSCHGDADHARRYLVLPGLKSSRIHIADL